MKTFTKRIFIGSESERTSGRHASILAYAFFMGPFQSISKVTSRPTKMPKWTPDSLRERSPQGQRASPARRAGHLEGGAVGIAADLSLLTPRPETCEKTLIKSRAGEIS